MNATVCVQPNGYGGHQLFIIIENCQTLEFSAHYLTYTGKHEEVMPIAREVANNWRFRGYTVAIVRVK